MKIKFIANTVKWFDKLNGNTYHSVRITRTSDRKVIASGFTYGYGDQYRQTALQVMSDVGWLPIVYRNLKNDYERENNYPIQWITSYGLKRDCIANTKIGGK